MQTPCWIYPSCGATSFPANVWMFFRSPLCTQILDRTTKNPHDYRQNPPRDSGSYALERPGCCMDGSDTTCYDHVKSRGEA